MTLSLQDHLQRPCFFFKNKVTFRGPGARTLTDLWGGRGWALTAQLSVYHTLVFVLDMTILSHMDDPVVTQAPTFRFKIGPCIYSASHVRPICYGIARPTHQGPHDGNEYCFKTPPGPTSLGSAP